MAYRAINADELNATARDRCAARKSGTSLSCKKHTRAQHSRRFEGHGQALVADGREPSDGKAGVGNGGCRRQGSGDIGKGQNGMSVCNGG